MAHATSPILSTSPRARATSRRRVRARRGWQRARPGRRCARSRAACAGPRRGSASGGGVSTGIDPVPRECLDLLVAPIDLGIVGDQHLCCSRSPTSRAWVAPATDSPTSANIWMTRRSISSMSPDAVRTSRSYTPRYRRWRACRHQYLELIGWKLIGVSHPPPPPGRLRPDGH